MSEVTTRKRVLPGPKWSGRTTGQDQHINGSPPVKVDSGTVVGNSRAGTQITVSKGNPFHSRTKGDVGDIGGDFFTQRSYVKDFSNKRRTSAIRQPDGNYWRDRTYVGPILAYAPNLAPFPPALNSSNAQLDALGSTAISRCKPTNSVADVSTFLGELLKDGLPRLAGASTWKQRTLHARNAGDEFLNVQFGWLPIVNEVRSFADVVRHGRAALAQYERDAGRVVRRRYNFPVIKERSESYLGSAAAFYAAADSTLETPTLGNLVRVREKTQRRWFSGAFTYYLPSGYDSRKELDRFALSARNILGATLTPETLWNLAPWSWAVDWVTNTGDVLSNVSSYIQDGLLLRYGYMMEHTIVSDTYYLDRSHFKDRARPEPLVLVTETKMRRRAHPFGFGVTWDGLSAIQVAILAALGITRG